MPKSSQMPDIFPFEARMMSISQAATHYRRCTRTIRQWAEACGDGLLDAMIRNGLSAARRGGGLGARRARAKAALATLPKAEPLDKQAMRHLQWKTRWVCYSSRVHSGDKDVYYHVGNRKLTFDELIALAEQYGFQPASVRADE